MSMVLIGTFGVVATASDKIKVAPTIYKVHLQERLTPESLKCLLTVSGLLSCMA
jgi:hypothetical protein